MLMHLFQRPETLQEGIDYYLLRLHPNSSVYQFTRVLFTNATSCPAVVVVQDEHKRSVRCNRRDLFIISPPQNNSLPK